MLREQSNIGLVQASGSNWKAVKAQACDLESKGQLQAALNLINEAMKQADQPSHEMLQYGSVPDSAGMLDICQPHDELSLCTKFDSRISAGIRAI